MSRLKELRVAAEAATPGPWGANGHMVLWNGEGLFDAQGNMVPTARCVDEDDASFIAQANPETVLALIALVKELSAALGGTVWLLARSELVGEPLRLARAALASAATWMEE